MTLPPALRAVPPSTVLFAAGGMAMVAGLVFGWRVYRRRRAQSARLRAVTECAYEYLRDVLLPDPQGIPLHLDFVLLTGRGIVVVDLREVTGNVFGGDQMDDWTVINGSQRFTFANPQAALYDRQASVRLVARETPVEGRIVFGGRSVFPKGLPTHTRLLAALTTDFPPVDRQAAPSLPDSWVTDWQSLRAACSPSSLVAPRAAV